MSQFETKHRTKIDVLADIRISRLRELAKVLPNVSYFERITKCTWRLSGGENIESDPIQSSRLFCRQLRNYFKHCLSLSKKLIINFSTMPYFATCGLNKCHSDMTQSWSLKIKNHNPPQVLRLPFTRLFLL